METPQPESKPVVRSSDITLKVGLDDQNFPQTIHWTASDSPYKDETNCKAFMLSIWDATQMRALRIDLHTPQMTIEEMNTFVFETIATLSETYLKTTNNKELAAELRDYAMNFGRKTGVLKSK